MVDGFDVVAESKGAEPLELEPGVVSVNDQPEKVEGQPKEPAAPVSETPTTPPLKDTPINETPEFKEALIEAQKGWDRRIASLKAESDKAKVDAQAAKAEYESAKADLDALKVEHDETVSKAFGDDPDARQAYLDRKATNDAKREVLRYKAEAERKLAEAERMVWSVNMARKAQSLHQETGVPVEELEECTSLEAMEVKALRFQLKQPAKVETSVKPPEPPVTPPDSGISTGKGGKLSTKDYDTMDIDAIAEHPSTKARYK